MQTRPRTSRRTPAPVAPTMFPTSMPGATLSEKTQGFMRFLPSKHHLDAAIPLRSAITALQITIEIRRPRLQTSHEAAIPLQSARLNSTLQWRTRLSANERRPHQSHRRGSPYRRREPLCDAAIPLRSAITALQITIELRCPRLQTCTCSSHSIANTVFTSLPSSHLYPLHIPTRQISTLSTSLLSSHL